MARSVIQSVIFVASQQYRKFSCIFLLAKSSHFLVRITPAVRTRGSHFQFAFYQFAISQFAVRKLPNPLDSLIQH